MDPEVAGSIPVTHPNPSFLMREYLSVTSVDDAASMFSKTVRQIERTLEKQSIDYQAVIQELGQAEAVKLREGGKSFCLTDHVRGLVLAQLSSQRPWGPIARNLSRIGKIFLGYNPKKLKKADPNDLVAAIKDLKCGNLKIAAQMKALVSNIGVLERIALDHESIDCYVTSESPTIIAKELGKGKRYKLQEVGFTLGHGVFEECGDQRHQTRCSYLPDHWTGTIGIGGSATDSRRRRGHPDAIDRETDSQCRVH